ncbi:MAG TPA: methyltransferase domain-containing protein [Ilumatobacteraceae bacterium]|nr:methyltransferase domain-containing protein [Ilumatobacteraceae bacterium]
MQTASYRHYSGNSAEDYERYFVPAIGGPVSVELLRAAALRQGERVLDVGCGTGIVARQAAVGVGVTGAVTGLDVANDMIAVARAQPPLPGASIVWRQGDATSLPFADGSFDVALCQMSLMFVEDRVGAIREMHRVLSDHGRVVVSTPGLIQPTFELMEQAIVDHISPSLAGFVRMVFSMHDPAILEALLRDGGFVDVESTVYTATLDLPPPAEFLWQYINLTPMARFVVESPRAAQDAMEAQVVETWQPHMRGGRTPVDQPMVLVTGARP